MKKITVVYSPLCEANGAFLEQLYEWLPGWEFDNYSYDAAPKEYKAMLSPDENCFIDVFFDGIRIGSVPLHRERLLSALGMEAQETGESTSMPNDMIYSEEEIRKQLFAGNLEFIPITRETFREEMSMCLRHYPFGNPAEKHHGKCRAIKERVFLEAWEKEGTAGVYARLNGKPAGLLEVFPRELVKKYGYMTGTDGDDAKNLTVACYEVAFGIPRAFMIDELMYRLLQSRNLFFRKRLEGIGVFEWNDGFNPYWVYEKYGFHKTEQKRENIVVMAREL